MDLSVVSQFMSLSPDMMYKATKMVESAQAYFPGDVDSQEEYLKENLIDTTLEYALTLLEDKKVRDYMDVPVYTNGKSFSAPTLALYNVASMPEMKQRIQAKLSAKGGVRKEEVDLDEAKQEENEPDWRKGEIRNLRQHRQTGTRTPYTDRTVAHFKNRGVKKEKGVKEETELVQEKKRPKLAGRKFNGKNPWWNSDGDDKPYEPGDDVKKTRKEEFAVEAKNKQGKEQGADGKACWKGYKYAGTENGKDKCVPMESIAEIAAEYFISEGLNEYGIDILIEEMGIDAFCDYVETLADQEVLLEWRRGAGGTKVRGSGTSKSGKSIGSLKGGAKASAIRGTAEHKARKAEKEKEGSKSSGMTAALKSQSKVASAKKTQPATKSTPTQTTEKAKGGILGALKARAEKDIKSVQQSVNTVRQVGARRAAEVKATYDAVRARGRKAEQSASATRARRRATVATGRAAQAAGRTAVKAAGAAGAAAGKAVAAKRAGKSNAQAAGAAVGTLVAKMKKEEKELLTRYFIEAEIAFNYDEVQEIFESIDQEHFDYYLNQATVMFEESEPTALELIQERLSSTFNANNFEFSDWRQLTEKKSSDDEATGKFVRLTQTNRTDNTPDVKGKRKDGVIINPQVDMRREEVEQLDEVSPPGAKFKRMAKHIKSKYAEDGLTDVEKRKAFGAAWKAYKNQRTEETQIDELNRYEKETGTSSGSLNMPKGRPTQSGGTSDPVMRIVRQSLRKQEGKPVGQQKKVPGKKPPVAGEYGSGRKSPAQIVAARRAAAQRSQDNMSSRFD